MGYFISCKALLVVAHQWPCSTFLLLFFIAIYQRGLLKGKGAACCPQVDLVLFYHDTMAICNSFLHKYQDKYMKKHVFYGYAGFGAASCFFLHLLFCETLLRCSFSSSHISMRSLPLKEV